MAYNFSDQPRETEVIYFLVLTKKSLRVLKKKKVLTYIFYEINAVWVLLYRKCLFFEDWYQWFVLLMGVTERSL